MPLVGDLEFQEFGVGENNTELVVQLVKQRPQIGVLLCHVSAGSRRLGCAVHARSPAVPVALTPTARLDVEASRHNVSVKMRIDPPAVRTYSTLPAEIQL